MTTTGERAMQGLKATTVVPICYGYGIEANMKWQVSLEFAGSRVPHEVLPGKLETPEEVAGNILEASRHVEKSRLFPFTNCGMAPLSMELARGKLHALGKR